MILFVFKPLRSGGGGGVPWVKMLLYFWSSLAVEWKVKEGKAGG